ncbi:hypothetical protein JMJ55_23955 [Belnapia sp. T6]|uniref:EamA domain-containing protein n=1 Tax=Belnapia mucosa TaxID=2804532 RepID=A0ABS1V9N8_9PROT|nr:hypothetical protein [Belnapia mucosa]MBL6458395.1 hypothetical protein [Belnapia mucosa]
MAAALVVVLLDDVSLGGVRQILGVCLVLSASAVWSGFGLLTARLKIDPIGTAATVAVLPAIGYLPLYLLLVEPQLHVAGAAVVLTQVAIQGVLIGTVSVFVYSWVVQRLGRLAPRRAWRWCHP